MRALKAMVSSESMELPLGHPAIALPLKSDSAEMISGSNDAATITSLPRALRPSTVLAMAALFGAVASTTSAPPSF